MWDLTLGPFFGSHIHLSSPINVTCGMYVVLSCSVLLHLASHCLWKQLPNFSPHVQSDSSLSHCLRHSQNEFNQMQIWAYPSKGWNASEASQCPQEEKHSLLHDPVRSTLFLPTCLPISCYPSLTITLLYWASLSSFITKAPSWPCAVLLFFFF